jgi:uncharacterized RmlC-like cupin family protein
VHEHREPAFFLMRWEEAEPWKPATNSARRPSPVPVTGLYSPPGVPHVAVNRSHDTRPCPWVRAPIPEDQESVVMRPGLDAQVP